MLHHRKYPQKVIKSFAYAAVAKAEGADLIYFSPHAVDFNKKVINGYVYENGAWQKAERPFPDVIYNTGSPDKLAKSIDIIKKLKEDIPFTTNSIGNKLNVYERLKISGEFSNYLIPSEIIYSTKHFFSLFDLYNKVILKPVIGHQGRDILFISGCGDQYKVLVDTIEYFFNYNDMRKYISGIINKESYLLQPYISSKTKAGLAYDFRLHVQKNEENKWIIAAIYPRIAPNGSVISNISKGGSTYYLEPFLKQEFGDNWLNIKKYLEKFALQLANNLEQIQYDYFKENIDELGIDIGLDDTRKIWIYEVNWRPGCPPSFYLELDVVKNMVRYAMYLANLKVKNPENV